MATIKAPFNFVPLNKDVFIPDWNDQISQDIPFSDGEDGEIDITLRNITPLFVRNGKSQTSNIPDEYSAYIKDENGNKIYFIPATTLKGMVRSTLEILSFSMIESYDDDFFGYRNFDTKIPTGKEYVKNMQNINCGWLYKDGDVLRIKTCGEPEKIEISDLKKQLPEYTNVEMKDAFEKHQYFYNKIGEKYPEINDMTLVCTGYMNNKKHEYLFPKQNLQPYTLSDDVKKAFLSVYKPSRPYYKKLNESLRKGDRIPVFFQVSNQKIISLGLTRMYRLPYKHHVKDGINQVKKDINGNETNGKDLTECMFGHNDNQNCLKGRVQFGNAFTYSMIKDNELIDETGVLGSPLASFYPLYLAQNGMGYDTYDSEKIEIAGRKRYRIHTDSYITEIPKGNGNEKTITKLKLIPSDKKFSFKIRFHNLKPVEIGALLSALTFHNSKNAYHNNGMAKSYGYGKMEIVDCQLLGLAHGIEDYLLLFEKQMSSFTLACNLGLWAKTIQIRRLVSIASEHDKNLEIMDLDDYKNYKKNSYFSQLTEKDESVESHVTKIDIMKHNMRDVFDEVDNLTYKKKYNEALAKCDEILKNLGVLEDVDIEHTKENIRKLRDSEYEMNTRLQEEKEARNRQQQIEGGLVFLEEKYPTGEYKVTGFKGLLTRVNSWLKKSGNQTIPTDQISILERNLIRIYQSITKEKEKKEWLPEGKIWKSIQNIVDTDSYKTIVDNFNEGQK